MASLLAAGLPIDRALESSSQYQRDVSARKLSLALAESLKAGLSISASFDGYPSQFDPLYRQIIATGETTGNLADAFRQISDYREKADRARARIRRAAAYPILVLIVAMGAIAFLLTSVVPTYQSLYAEFNATLPKSTQTLIATASWLHSNRIQVLLGLLLLLATLALTWRSGPGREWRSRIVLNAPLLSLIGRPVAWGVIARGMGTMLSAGVLLQDTLDRAKLLSGNALIRKHLESVHDRVASGEPLSSSLAECASVEPIVVQMPSVGEESGNLGDSLTKAAEFLESEVDHRTETMLTLAEPVLILLVGAIVGLILFALYLPMFELVSQSG